MYRNDLEAALARADAAERELAELREADSAEHARAQALEQELAKARAEVTRLQPAAKSPRPPKPSPARLGRNVPAGRPAVKAALGIGGLLAMGGLAIAIIFGQRSCIRNQVLNKPGELDAVYVVHTRDGQPRLIAVSDPIGLRTTNYGGSRWRLDLVDPVSGDRLVRKVFSESGRRQRPELAPAGPGRFWCDLAGSFVGKRRLIEQCDVDTLEVVVSASALIAKNPQLAAGFSSSPEVDQGTGDLVVTTTSAETLIISARDFTSRPFHASKDLVCLEGYVGGGRAVRAALEAAYHAGPGAAGGSLSFNEGGNCATLAGGADYDPALQPFLRGLPRLEGMGQEQHGTRGSVRIGAQEYSFQNVEGGRREALSTESRDGQFHPVGDTTFIHPGLLAAGGSDLQALVLPQGGGVVVVHRDSLDDNRAQIVVSRLGLDDGRLRWSVTVPPGELKFGLLVGDTVLVALRRYNDKQSFVVAIGWQDGTERWRYLM